MSDIRAITFDDAVAVTPSDSTNDPGAPQGFAGLYSGSGGDITLVTPAGTTVLLKSTAAATIYAIRCVRVKSTGTAATNIVGLKALP